GAGRMAESEPEAVELTGAGCVQVAYLHGFNVSHSWHESMMRLIAWDVQRECRVVSTAGPLMVECDAGGLVEGRNLAVKRYLDETPHEWLWFIDTDMGFSPDTIDRLVQGAHPVKRPVIGALCFALRRLERDGMGGRRCAPVPTLYTWARSQEGHVGFTTLWEFPNDTVMQIAGTGAACLLIHRSILEKLRADN